ncbi:hypothetical protein AGMMS50276_02670 [Synergistales bacterium]|nr:hypothetical protein AGMMS50276_02670 [Synergistales bacterium]
MSKKLWILLLTICVAVGVTSAERGEAANEALHSRAKNLYDVGDYRAALNLYEKILENDPNDVLAIDLSAWCMRYLGDRKSAVAAFEKALALSSGEDAVWILIGLGEIYLDSGVYEDSQKYFKDALLAAPDNEEATERASRNLEMAREFIEKVPTSGRAKADKPQLNDAEERQEEVLLADNPSKDAEQTTEESAESDEPDEPDEEQGTEQGTEQASEQVVDKESEPLVSQKDVSEKKDAGKTKQTKKEPAKKAPASSKSPSAKKPAQKPADKPANKPAQRPIAYGVTIGDNIKEAIKKLEQSGHPLMDAPFDKNGKTFYPIKNPPKQIPDFLTPHATSIQFYIVGYNDAVLSVIVQLNYDDTRGFEELKATMTDNFAKLTGVEGTRGVTATENIFSYEIGRALPNSYGIWSVVTDKGHGICSVEVQHIDLTNMSYYMSSRGGK